MIHPGLCGPQDPKGGPFYLSLRSMGVKGLRISKWISVQWIQNFYIQYLLNYTELHWMFSIIYSEIYCILHGILCVTWIFPSSASFDKANNEQDENEECNGTHETNEPTLRGNVDLVRNVGCQTTHIHAHTQTHTQKVRRDLESTWKTEREIVQEKERKVSDIEP